VVEGVEKKLKKDLVEKNKSSIFALAFARGKEWLT
jgi:hypothetical protein